ncbi:hypothetical protein LJ707_09510 [Mucilaginibacter sp. UR6-1]|uniref:DUF7009 family protein n=1 Tax=Mucilaginibacter sp. UR6-1 TaxID=1435643 RepID=UPI001E5511BE|nr:hypothetical protein [Mucilaginibacter sp. UR6-1]MCC8409168.1 hypothetical protein [Mucilaginibacter sp. UR6-1]
MKIRIKGNSIRYRLTRSEVERFGHDGYLEEITDFGAAQLIYALRTTAADELWADFKQNKITLFMPLHMRNEWLATDKVGFENRTANFYLLVEKDFQCLDNVEEDQSDNYPNPQSLQV